MPFQRLIGRTAVVVGAGYGHGRASASRLAMEGAEVVAIDPDADALESLRATIESRQDRVRTLVAPTDELEALIDVAARCRAEGPVDVLVNHHLRIDLGTVESGDLHEFEQVVHHNLVGPMAATKAFLPLLKAAGRAAIVHLGSVDGIYGNPVAVGYSASKGGLLPLTHIMAREFAPYDIRVNAVATCLTNQPDPADGRIRDAAGDRPTNPGQSDAFRLRLAAATPLKRFGTPEEWAGPVAFLASDDAAYVTGSVLVVDAGRTGLTPGTFPWDSGATT